MFEHVIHRVRNSPAAPDSPDSVLYDGGDYDLDFIVKSDAPDTAAHPATPAESW